MPFSRFSVKVTYIPDKQAEINLKVLRAVLRRIILSSEQSEQKELLLENIKQLDYNKSEERSN